MCEPVECVELEWSGMAVIGTRHRTGGWQTWCTPAERERKKERERERERERI